MLLEGLKRQSLTSKLSYVYIVCDVCIIWRTKMSNTEKKSINQQDTEPSLIIVSSVESNNTNLYSLTKKGKKAVTEGAYDLWYSKAQTLEEKVVLTTLWETGVRIGEAISIVRDNLSGRVLTVTKNKTKHKCSVCGKVKASHTRKVKGTCPQYTKKIELEYKQIELSEKLYGLVVEWFALGHSNLFIYREKYYNDLLKTFDQDLSAHKFRRGMGCFYQNKGAPIEVIGALLGHDGTQNVKFYSNSVDNEANEFRRRVFAGEDTRKVSQLSVTEYNTIQEANTRRIMREELASLLTA